MDYAQWVEEYKQEISKLKNIVNSLKKQKSNSNEEWQKVEINNKINEYQSIIKDFENTVSILNSRGQQYG